MAIFPREYFSVSLMVIVAIMRCDGRVGYRKPSDVSAAVTGGPTPPSKPTPAFGASAPTANSFSSTTGLAFDFFSGISYRQLKIAKEAIDTVNVMAALSGNVTISRGQEVFGKIANYV